MDDTTNTGSGTTTLTTTSVTAPTSNAATPMSTVKPTSVSYTGSCSFCGAILKDIKATFIEGEGWIVTCLEKIEDRSKKMVDGVFPKKTCGQKTKVPIAA